MNVLFETVIVGAGLAGASCAAVLSQYSGVLVLDAALSDDSPEVPAVYTSASSIGAGISSPLMSRRARPIFRMEAAVAALDALRQTTGGAFLFSSSGILKLAGAADQADEFKDAADRWPDHGRWYSSDECRNRWTNLNAPFGLIHVTSGFSVSIPAWCQKMIRFSVSKGAEYRPGCRMMDWRESATGIYVRYRDAMGEEHVVKTSRLVLAPGADYLRFPALAALRLHPIKGQWVRISRPDTFSPDHPFTPLSGHGYLVDDGQSLMLGSTFEHGYTHLRTTRIDVRKMIQTASNMVPDITQSAILSSGAAIRVTVPGIRLPMVGPLQPKSRVWIISGLGAKGLLMAPLIASELLGYFEKPSSIPREFGVSYSV